MFRDICHAIPMQQMKFYQYAMGSRQGNARMAVLRVVQTQMEKHVCIGRM